MRDHYLIGDYGNGQFSPIHTDGKTRAEAEQARRWQGVGNFGSAYHICKPHESERGAFVSVETGEQFAVSRGALTENAWSVMCDRIWSES